MKVEMQNNNSNYIHPSSHSADMIDETETRKFVSKKEKEEYSDKYTKVEMNTLLSDKVDKVTGKDLFSGSYNDLINKPTIPITLPANGGNADTVNNKHSTEFVNTFFLPSPMTSIKYFKIAELNTNIAPYSNGLTLIISGISDFGNNKVGTDMLQVSTRSYVCLQVYNILDSDDSSTYGYINNPNGKTEIWTKKVIYAYPSSVAVLTSIDATYGLLLEQTQEPVGIIYVDKIKYIKTTDTIPAGAKGDKGDTGLQGIQGVKGDKGDTGLQGVRGEQGIQGIQGLRGLTGAKGDKGDKGEKGDRGASGSGGGGQSVYDLVIKTQADFAAMSELSGVNSICILDGKYTFERTFYIPSDVISITGIGNVELEFSNLPVKQRNYCFNCEKSCSISNINIKINIDYEGTYCCFAGFREVANCTARLNCNVDKMVPDGYRNEVLEIGFLGCSNLTNCKSNSYTQGVLAGDISGYTASYSYCTNVINCKADTGNLGDVLGVQPSYNFESCSCLVNCLGTCESNRGGGYIFYNCSYLNNCYMENVGIFLGGANTHVDTLTVAEY